MPKPYYHSSIMEQEQKEPPWPLEPWKDVEYISLANMQLPPFILYQAGWKETQHTEIHNVKEQITLFNNPDEWELRKKITNPYEAIFSGHEHFPSVSSTEPLSRSYFKMIEMINILPAPLPTTFCTAHVCEGPGGFIQAITDYASTNSRIVPKIYAMTLRATKATIPGWRRSAKYLRDHPEITLEYGADDTGDIMSVQNQRNYVKSCRNSPNPITLYTADGGFDFSIDYTKQEQQAFPLILASIIIGLQVLSEDGCMIIKCFDIYSDVMKDLIVGTGSFFDKMTLYKPATSRPCNSERYFIAAGYKGHTKAARWIQHLQEAQERQRQSVLTRLFLCPLPKPLIAAFEEQIVLQENLQMQSIYDTLNLDKSLLHKYVERNITVSKGWCDTFGIPMKSYFHLTSA